MEQFLEDIKDLEVTTVARAQEAIDQKKQHLLYWTQDLPILPKVRC